ncbi:MAG: type II toxin-antitoxin system RatA family toxin [Gammaproteobacteria bacterium]|nr:type II toxin-antitoxin system RatA family toxin [Gammaproteobacteria bacterium]
MTDIQRSAHVPYTAAQMYQLVNDVAAYPQFLPWCHHVDILDEGERELTARVTLSLGKLQQSFTTRNRMYPHESIEMELVEGPFQHLMGIWAFEPLDSGCRVSLDMRFEFKSKLARMAMGGPFHKVVNSLVDAFIQRARSVYG